MKQIMVLNLGSTSFKFKLYTVTEQAIAEGSVDAIGSGDSLWKIVVGTEKWQERMNCPNHQAAFDACVQRLTAVGVLTGIGDLAAVGYKAVLAGGVNRPQDVTPELLERMERMAPLAPAHNPIYVGLMRFISERYPQLRQIACFETVFHATMPLYRAVYGVPKEWREWGVRRYGFHGASHSYIAQRVRQINPSWRRVISVHLGGSCSVCAIKDGKSIASSMGGTLQSGLFNNNRVGDFEPFFLPMLAKRLGGYDAVMQALSTQSGFLGLSGVSNDLRKIEAAAAQGNEDAQLAIDAFCDNITGYIGMDVAYLGGLDAIAFTGGIGQHSALTRRRALSNFGYLGLKLDEAANESGAERISAEDSRVAVLVLETDEEMMIARQVAQCLSST